MVEGPGGGQVGNGATLALLGPPAVELALGPVVGNLAPLEPFGGRSATEAATRSPGRG